MKLCNIDEDDLTELRQKTFPFIYYITDFEKSPLIDYSNSKQNPSGDLIEELQVNNDDEKEYDALDKFGGGNIDKVFESDKNRKKQWKREYRDRTR